MLIGHLTLSAVTQTKHRLSNPASDAQRDVTYDG
jgi:hypothetical protein